MMAQNTARLRAFASSDDLPAQKRSNLRALPPPDAARDTRIIAPDTMRDVLRTAALLAKENGESVEAFLIHNGYMSEIALYRGIAHWLGLPFIPFPTLLDPQISARDALQAGLAPVDPRPHILPHDTPRFVYAPQGDNLESLIATDAKHLALPGVQIGITPPSRFCASVRATFGKAIADDASRHIHTISDKASASSLELSIWLSFLLAVAGIMLVSITLSARIWHMALVIATCFPILPGLLVKLLALRRTKTGDLTAPPLTDCDLPHYCVLVPVYREAAILPQLIASLVALDYPKAKLDIKLLIETDDIETLVALKSIVLPSYFDVILCPRGTPRTKPRALTIGLAYSDAECVVVYDAEDEPDRDQLKKAAAIFARSDAQLACLQARLTIDNLADSWLTRQFALEYSALFDVLLPGLADLNQPVPLGGTSNHFRRAALDAVGAWDPWNVTEDADLGMRLYRAGYRVKTFKSTTHEEAPATFKAWLNQRTRWLKGWMQTAAVHLRPHSGARGKMNIARGCMLVLATTLSPLSILFHPTLLFALNTLIDYCNGPVEPDLANEMLNGCFLAMFMASFLFDMVLAARGAAERRITLTLADLLGIIPYSHLKTWAAWRGFFELLHAPFHWRKTDHGLARTSRRNRSRKT